MTAPMRRSRRTPAIVVLCCLLAGPAAAGPPEPAGGKKPEPAGGKKPAPSAEKAPAPAPPVRNIGGPGDYGLREKVVKRLSSEPDLAGAGWKLVLVNGGAVFSGTVPTWTLKRRALVLAGVTRGIVNVTDQMQVVRGDIGDSPIAEAVSQALEGFKEPLGIQAFDVEVQDGVVTLSGTVKDFASRVRAEELAGSVGGVMRVDNRLRAADAPSGTDDASIRKAIAAYLMNPRAYPYRVELEVQVKGGKALLRGRVPYFLARQQAGAMVALIGGVTEVDNRIRVDPGTLAPMTVVKELP